MIGELIGAGINAGSRLIGMDMDRSARNADRDAQLMIAEQNRQLQKDFAQHGIRWKVDDAKAAGIHPLYALGANTTSFSPISIAGGGSTNYAETLGGMGQDITRAINATRTGDERVDAFTKTAQALELEGKKLDNDIKRASLASAVRTTTQASNPPLPGSVPEAKDFEERVRLMGSGVSVKTDPWSTNAEDYEKRYGDMAQEIAGIHNMYRDYLLTTGGRTPHQILTEGGKHPFDRFLFGDKPWLKPGGWADRTYRRFRPNSSGW